ncbi:hypothetical protein KEC54_19770 [Methylorubrum extorquens]|uniref:Uncharacterized protein n=1 Tax=Methylorubrum extorquens TaxID=408 RepID=A0AAX3WE01_METEX|nr:hypothetical protein [Methylorubrum extorquens]WHQ68598.1 hypothetical protein KEC54_19770 [Methylorubrum extorquens]
MSRLNDTAAAADPSDRQPGLLLLQDADDLLLGSNRFFFIVLLVIDGPQLQNEGKPWGKVSSNSMLSNFIEAPGLYHH